MPAWVLRGLEEEMGTFGGAGAATSMDLSWIHWVVVEVQEFPEMLEGLRAIKKALKVAAAVG